MASRGCKTFVKVSLKENSKKMSTLEQTAQFDHFMF